MFGASGVFADRIDDNMLFLYSEKGKVVRVLIILSQVILLILILSLKDRCTLGRVWQDGGERSCGTGTQLAAAAAPNRVNTHICPENCNWFVLVVFLYLCLCDFVDFPRRKSCFQFAPAVNGVEGGLVNIVSQVGQFVSQSVGVSSNTDARVWVWCGGLRRTGFTSITTWVYQY